MISQGLYKHKISQQNIVVPLKKREIVVLTKAFKNLTVSFGNGSLSISIQPKKSYLSAFIIETRPKR